jgi:hypothetical protein
MTKLKEHFGVFFISTGLQIRRRIKSTAAAAAAAAAGEATSDVVA